MPSSALLAASARIVTPEEAALNSEELALMRIFVGVGQLAGTPIHIVQFADGVAAMVVGDPSNEKAWRNALIQVHEAALIGVVGPVTTKEHQS